MGFGSPWRRVARYRLSRIGGMAGLMGVSALFGAVATVALLDNKANGSASYAAPVYFANCREAIQAGMASMHYGAPGYRAPLDADHDDVACEPYRYR